MSNKTRYNPWEISDMVFKCIKLTTEKEINDYIDSIMLPKDQDLLNGIRETCVYYLSKQGTKSELVYNDTIEKLIANEIPLLTIVSNSKLTGMSMVTRVIEWNK